MLHAKVAHLKPHERRGTFVLDEMKLSEAIGFDSQNLLFNGFTDLGEHTPEGQKRERGDHALVLLFQPFGGSGVQTLGAFLSKGCASSGVLHKLILECIILLENAGFFVDVVTSDGATWNRSMWKLFGLSGYDNSCEHPCAAEGSNRRLFFCSDFHHLVKNFRNFLISESETWTPSGVVKLAHFQAVIECDDRNGKYGLRIAHKLTREHLNPQTFKKMNVGLALQLFRPEVAAAMSLYRDQHDDLHDCDPTIKFTEIFSEVIAVMSSRHRNAGSSSGSDSAKIIEDFIQYLEEWRFQAGENSYKFMSSSTHQGFLVTLKTALEVCTFLTEHCGFRYLMTARLNQDVLKAFFGMLRSCCGSHNHPDAILFIQVYRLLSFYSLVKPPKGSNVEGLELFETLLNFEDVNDEGISNHDEWDAVLDLIILKGSANADAHRPGDEHDYNVPSVSEEVQAYFSGFVARKMRTWTKCAACQATLTKEKGEGQQDALINQLSKGFLLYPSNDLFDLPSACVRAVLKTVGMQEIHAYTFLRIADNLLAESMSFVGCPEHEGAFTKKIINYYIMVRCRILPKKYNQVHDEKRRREQKNRKQAKL